MVKKLARNVLLSVVICFTFGTGVSYALGLGAISVRSGLNENLDASIELVSPTDDELRSLLVNLAAPEEFERLGIEYPYILGSLRFRIFRREGSKPEIRVLSSKAILDPYLHFLVDVETTTGRFLREYTILLDPPGSPVARYQPTSPAVSAPGTGQAAAPVPAPMATDGSYGPVKPKETLWSIASKTRPDENVSVQQMMLALVNANPDAFDGRNINSLKRGSTLRIPTREAITSLGKVEAMREAKRQVADGTPTRSQPAKKTPVKQAKAPQSTTKPAPTKAPAKQEMPVFERDDARLAELERELEAARAKERELKDRLAKLDDEAMQGAKTPQQTTAKTPEAKPQPPRQAVQDSDVWQPVGEPTVPTVRTKPGTPTGIPAQPQVATAPQAESPTPPVEPAQLRQPDPVPASPAPVTEVPKPAVPASAPQQVAKAPVKPQPVVKRPRPRPVVIEPPQPKGFFDDIVEDTLADPTLTALAGMGVVGLLSGALLGARRQRRSSEEAGELDEDEFDLHDGAEGDFGATQIMGAGAEGDPLAVADMHLANGRNDDAIKTLQMAASQDPGNEEFKLKMLEIYEKTGDKGGFDSLTQSVFEQGAESQPRVWDHIKRIAQKISPDNNLVTAGAVAAGAVGVAAAAASASDSIVPDQAMDTQAMGAASDELPDMLDLSDLGLDDDSLGMPELATGDEDAGEVAGLGLDFDLDLDGGLTEADKAEANDFDLGDLDLSGGDGDSDTPVVGADDDFDLSGLDLGSEISLEDAAAAAAPSLETPATEDSPGLDMDDDLGLDFSADALGGDVVEEPAADLSGDDDGLNFDADDLGLDMGTLDSGGTSDASDTDDDAGLDFGDLDMSGLGDDSTDDAGLSDDGLGLDFSPDGADDLGLGGLEADAAGADLSGGELDLGGFDDLDSGSSALNLDTPTEDAPDLGADDDALGLDFSPDSDDLESAIQQASAADEAKPQDAFGETVVLDGLELGPGADDDLDLGDLGELAGGGDDGEVDTKLDLAKAYIDMGDPEGARDMLEEVLREGNEAQKSEAQGLINDLV